MLTNLTIEEIRKGIASKEFSYSQLIDAYHSRFEKLRCLNAHIEEYWESAKEHARKLDNNDGSCKQGPLTGIPVAIKDLFLVKDTRTTAGSKILEDFIAPYDAFVIEKLKNAGYIIPFKTNLDEFAMGSSNQTSVFGPVVNPWILSDCVARVPGGSSGGSAAAVAANMCVGALGTDTGGSVRQPASFCGIVGFKPTYGRCSRRGVIAFASSLDHPGVFARNVQDACIILESMAGYDAMEATSLKEEVPALSSVSGNVKEKRIGVAFQAFDHLDEEYRACLNSLLESLKKEGAIIEPITLPSFELAIKLYYIIAPAEAASNLARYDGIRYGPRGAGDTFEEILYNTRALFGTEVKRRILIGNYVLLAGEYEKFFGKAVKLRAQIVRQMDGLFENHDAILLPTTASTAFEIGAQRTAIEMYLEDLYTVLANIYGGPAMQIPFTLTRVEAGQRVENPDLSVLNAQTHLPVGIQIIGRRSDEINVVVVAKKIEEIVDWNGKIKNIQLVGGVE